MKFFKTLIITIASVVLFSSCGDKTTGPTDDGTSPKLTAINPSKVMPGDNTTITGNNFGAERGESKIYFNDLQVETYVSWSNTEIKVIVPNITSSGVIKLVSGAKTSNTLEFYYDDGPRILSAGAGKAYVDQEIEIKGINFGDSKGSVEFNGTPATNITTWTNTSIKVVVPQNATTGNLIVKTSNGKASNPFYFTISTKDDPFINMIYPSTVSPGDEIKISGRNFGSTQGSSYVDFNGVKGTQYTLWTSDSIRVKVPATATTGFVRVFVGTQASNTINLTIVTSQPDPIINSLNKTSFETGETITILGKYFGLDKSDSSYVYFNDIKATDYLYWDATMIKVTVPKNAVSGKLKVVIGKQTSNLVDYTITVAPKAPKITSLNQTIAQSGQIIQINGTDFGAIKGNSYVMFGTVQATNYVTWTDTEIDVEVPDMPSGQVDIYVLVNNLQSNKVSFTIQQKAKPIVETAEVPAGSFMMGSSNPNAGDSYPQHKVTLTKPILVGKTEVTQAQYKKVMNQLNPSRIKDDNNPVEQLTWLAAIDFCNRLSKLEGLTEAYTVNGNKVTWNKDANGWRLLTEAEWEYACRAGSAGNFGNLDGNEGAISKLGWTNINTKDVQHVGLLQANDFGLYDMHGNVAEWVWDLYDFYEDTEQVDPIGATDGIERVFRGGSYLDGPNNCSNFIRNSMDPTNVQYYVGFRVCRNK